MMDFLTGLCSSKNCAYRHVNVNSKAPTCEAFLRGYCALGNEVISTLQTLFSSYST